MTTKKSIKRKTAKKPKVVVAVIPTEAVALAVEIIPDAPEADHYVEISAPEPMVEDLLEHKDDPKTLMQRLSEWFS